MDNSTHGLSEQLMRYLDGELSETERTQIEAQLAKDPDLRMELENLQLSREAVRQFGLRQDVTAIRRQMLAETSPRASSINMARKITRYSLAVAASLLLLVVGITGYNFYKLSPDKLYDKHYQPYELSTSRNQARGTKIEQAYKGKNYEWVIKLGKQSNDPAELFLTSMAWLHKSEPANAIVTLRKILSHPTAGDELWKEEAEYYLALAYIKNKDYDFALELLNKIHENPAHLHYPDVSGKLIRQVKMLKWR